MNRGKENDAKEKKKGEGVPGVVQQDWCCLWSTGTQI